MRIRRSFPIYLFMPFIASCGGGSSENTPPQSNVEPTEQISSQYIYDSGEYIGLPFSNSENSAIILYEPPMKAGILMTILQYFAGSIVFWMISKEIYVQVVNIT